MFTLSTILNEIDPEKLHNPHRASIVKAFNQMLLDIDEAEARRGNPYPRRQRPLKRNQCLPSELGLEGYEGRTNGSNHSLGY